MQAEELLVTEFFALHADEAARLLEQAPAKEAAQLLEAVSAESAAGVVRRLAPFAGQECLRLMTPSSAGLLLSAMPPEISAGLLRRMKPENRDKLLEALSTEAGEPVRRLLSYPEGTAGALMDPMGPVLPADCPAGQALEQIRNDPANVYYYLYVVERGHRLVGVLDLKELMMAEPQARLSALMQRNVSSVRAATDLVSLVHHPGWNDYDALPVVDENGIFLGLIRQRLVRKIERELAGRPSGLEGGVAMGLAELCWVGMLELSELLAASLLQVPAAGQPDKGAS